MTESQQGANTKHYFRYIVENRNIDQKLNLNMYEGVAAIKTEFEMDLAKKVDQSNHDGSIAHAGQSKSLIIS